MYPFYTIIRTRCTDYLRKQNIHEEYVEFTSQLTDKTVSYTHLTLPTKLEV